MRTFRRTQRSWRGRLSVWRRLKWLLTWMRFSRRRLESIRRPLPVLPARWWFTFQFWPWPYNSVSQVKRKDAILTKCFHAFCYDCLRTRYETRWKIIEQSKVTQICILELRAIKFVSWTRNNQICILNLSWGQFKRSFSIAGSGNVPSATQHLVLQIITGDQYL